MNRKRYPSDLTDAQWEKLSSFLPAPQPLGRPPKWEMCLIINAIFYGMPNYRLDSLSLVCYHPFAGNSTRCPVGGYGRHRTRSHEQSGYLVPFPVNTSCKEAKWT